MKAKPKLNTCCPSGVDLHDTYFGYTLSLIAGKYKMIVLYWLSEHGELRFNEMQRSIANVSCKTLSLTLKELERDNLIVRNEYPQIPPKVVYTLTEQGRSIIPLLEQMCVWGRKHYAMSAKPVYITARAS